VAVERLAHFPLSGIIVPERNQADIREIIIGRFRVVCRVTPESIQIATIFRAARQIPGAAS
jgi:plasmid stabilization system protein ParE